MYYLVRFVFSVDNKMLILNAILYQLENAVTMTNKLQVQYGW